VSSVKLSGILTLIVDIAATTADLENGSYKLGPFGETDFIKISGVFWESVAH